MNISSTAVPPLPSSIPPSSPVPAPSTPCLSRQPSPPMSSPMSAPLSSDDMPSTSVAMGEVVKLAKEQTALLKTVAEDGKVLTTEVVNAIKEQSSDSKEFINLMKSILEKM
ncbi:PREDICTED: uncharacterized protein LOC108354658 [Rhagoletis zephyria]|uniref:uncharacterized protein LOC108354658 n=1 Tax=Rhagoletis zephyria TaxID=28612 RepID=UPI00081193BF|nr:PREDICTED: uncharacterized protein LOC108354658 [Rhagoletis zephyria]